MSFYGKTALVTGGSRGIGLHIGKRLALKGCNVILLSRSKDVLKHNIKHELPTIDNSQQHSYVVCDLEDTDSIYETVSSSNELKKVSILINSAGMSQNSLLANTNAAQVTKILKTNLTSSIVLSQLLIKPLLKNKPSSIVNISSVLGLKGTKGTSVYSASKAGLIGFTRAMAVELGSKDIRVNCISPGLVKETAIGMHAAEFKNALGKYHVPLDDVVSAVEFLLLNESVTGENLVIDGGYAI